MCLCPIGQMWFPCAKIIQIIMKKCCFSLLPMSGLFSKISVLIGQLWLISYCEVTGVAERCYLTALSVFLTPIL